MLQLSNLEDYKSIDYCDEFYLNITRPLARDRWEDVTSP